MVLKASPSRNPCSLPGGVNTGLKAHLLTRRQLPRNARETGWCGDGGVRAGGKNKARGPRGKWEPRSPRGQGRLAFTPPAGRPRPARLRTHLARGCRATGPRAAGTEGVSVPRAALPSPLRGEKGPSPPRTNSWSFCTR